MLASSIMAKQTNSSRNDMVDLSDQGIGVASCAALADSKRKPQPYPVPKVSPMSPNMCNLCLRSIQG